MSERETAGLLVVGSSCYMSERDCRAACSGAQLLHVRERLQGCL